MLKIQMFIHKLMNPLANKEGATAVEYGMLVALIAAVIVATVGILGGQVDTAFNKIVTALK